MGLCLSPMSGKVSGNEEGMLCWKWALGAFGYTRALRLSGTERVRNRAFDFNSIRCNLAGTERNTGLFLGGQIWRFGIFNVAAAFACLFSSHYVARHSLTDLSRECHLVISKVGLKGVTLLELG